MTPEQRKNARARLDLFLTASDGGSPVSRAELAGYLDAALDQMDADEGLMRRPTTVNSQTGEEFALRAEIDVLNVQVRRLRDKTVRLEGALFTLPDAIAGTHDEFRRDGLSPEDAWNSVWASLRKQVTKVLGETELENPASFGEAPDGEAKA